MRDHSERLQDILDAINNIERYADRDRETWESDELLQTWFVHHLQIIGEAVRALPQEILDLAPEIPARKIIGMRNILVHHYFVIDLDLVWEVIKTDLPILKSDVQRIIKELKGKNRGP